MFYFDTFADFIAMGRHGVFVWSAYGIALAIMVFMVVMPLQHGKAVRNNIQRQMRRDVAIAEAEQNQIKEQRGGR